MAGSDQRVGLAAGDPAFLSLNDSEYADEQECWKERSKKERAMLLTHGINPPYSKMTENRSGKAERDPAPSKHQETCYARTLAELCSIRQSVMPDCSGRQRADGYFNDSMLASLLGDTRGRLSHGLCRRSHLPPGDAGL